MTSQQTILKKGIHVQHTWGKRCDQFFFASDSYDPNYSTLNVSVTPGRLHLTAKTMQAFDQIWRHHSDYDWFLKADDDTYIVVDNLRLFLSGQNASEDIFFGQHFIRRRFGQSLDYVSGGAGYVISHQALKLFGNRDRRVCHTDQGFEDVEFSLCMDKLGVKLGDARDSMGRSRFHCFTPFAFISGDASLMSEWYRKIAKYWVQVSHIVLVSAIIDIGIPDLNRSSRHFSCVQYYHLELKTIYSFYAIVGL